MPELTINTLIKAIIIIIVIVLVVGSFIWLWFRYIKPQLEGLAVLLLLRFSYDKLNRLSLA